MQRQQIAITVAGLRSGGQIDLFSMALTVLALVLLFFRPQLWGLWLVVAFGLVEKYYALRSAFDSRLLQNWLVQSDITLEQQMQDLDQALLGLGLLKQVTERPLSVRLAGCMGLLYRQVLLLLAQVLGFFGVWVVMG